jgi:hypothetical protein
VCVFATAFVCDTRSLLLHFCMVQGAHTSPHSPRLVRHRGNIKILGIEKTFYYLCVVERRSYQSSNSLRRITLCAPVPVPASPAALPVN